MSRHTGGEFCGNISELTSPNIFTGKYIKVAFVKIYELVEIHFTNIISVSKIRVAIAICIYVTNKSKIKFYLIRHFQNIFRIEIVFYLEIL